MNRKLIASFAGAAMILGVGTAAFADDTSEGSTDDGLNPSEYCDDADSDTDGVLGGGFNDAQDGGSIIVCIDGAGSAEAAGDMTNGAYVVADGNGDGEATPESTEEGYIGAQTSDGDVPVELVGSSCDEDYRDGANVLEAPASPEDAAPGECE